MIICITFKYFSSQEVYADYQDTDYVKISNASPIDIEKIIIQNNKIDTEKIITEEINIEYVTQYKNNNELPKGTMKVIQDGRTGKQQITKRISFDENGNEQIEELSSITIVSPANKIIEIGTSTSRKAYKISKGSEVFVTSDSADIRDENNEQSRKITTLFRNTQLKVLEIKDDWCRVFVNMRYGWIKLENVSSIYENSSYQEKEYQNITKLEFDMALNKPSGLSIEQFQKMLTDEKDKNNIFYNNAEYFYYIEKEYNINGVFVAAVGIHESGWGKSNIAINKKNLFGYRAYDSSPYSSASEFNTYAECIDFISRVLVKYYLNPKGTLIYNGEKAVGTYYNGNTISAVNQKYASDSGWAEKVYNYMEYLYKKI